MALDQGGSSSRAIVFDQCGNVISHSAEKVSTQRLQKNWVEQSPAEVIGSLQSAARCALKQLTEQQRQAICSAGLICQRSSMLCWDKKNNQALTPILSWQDTRAIKILNRLVSDVEPTRTITGLYKNAHFGASKMRWCLDNLDQVKLAAKNDALIMAPLAAFLARELCGNREWLVDPVNASRTLLMDIDTGTWSEKQLATFGIQKSWLPDIIHSDEIFGVIKIDELEIPLKLVTGDQSAAAFADGLPQANNCYINIGTGAFLFRLSDQKNDHKRLLYSMLHCPENSSIWYVQEATVNGAASALQWHQQIAHTNNEYQNLSKQECFSLQKNAPYFLNGVGGLGAPDWCAEFGTEFVGEGDGISQQIAILESIAFLIARNIYCLYETERLPEHIIVSGGLAQNDWLCQLIANLLAVPVARIQMADASARGAAFLLSHNDLKYSASEEWLTATRKIFSVENNETVTTRYRQWTELMEQRLLSIQNINTQ